MFFYHHTKYITKSALKAASSRVSQDNLVPHFRIIVIIILLYGMNLKNSLQASTHTYCALNIYLLCRQYIFRKKKIFSRICQKL